MINKIPGVGSSIASPTAVDVSATATQRVGRLTGVDFNEILQAQTSQQLRFSAHAQERLRARDIHLSQTDEAQLSEAIDTASAKGAKESLVLLDDLALVVSVKNKVIITALERGENATNVFTNIDSAILVRRNAAQQQS
jgi:flagellar operon protein